MELKESFVCSLPGAFIAMMYLLYYCARANNYNNNTIYLPISQTKSRFPWISFSVILPPIEPIFISLGGSRNRDAIVVTATSIPVGLELIA